MKTICPNIKVSVLGAKGVGKSAITVRYLTKRFIGEYSSGLDISYQTSYTHGDVPIKVNILDTSNQDDCQAACHDTHDADAFVVVYSLTELNSFNFAMSEVSAIRSRSQDAPILLLGNKLDLAHARKVVSSEAFQLSESHSCRHAEVSAAECPILVHKHLQGLLVNAACNLRHKDRIVKRRKSLFENVSKRLGSVFRRKSLEDPPVSKNRISSRLPENENRRSV